jgi:hypothetical protein
MLKAFLEQEISGFLCSYDAEKLRFPAGQPPATDKMSFVVVARLMLVARISY